MGIKIHRKQSWQDKPSVEIKIFIEFASEFLTFCMPGQHSSLSNCSPSAKSGHVEVERNVRFWPKAIVRFQTMASSLKTRPI
jgi:hypothetical protein